MTVCLTELPPGLTAGRRLRRHAGSRKAKADQCDAEGS